MGVTQILVSDWDYSTFFEGRYNDFENISRRRMTLWRHNNAPSMNCFCFKLLAEPIDVALHWIALIATNDFSVKLLDRHIDVALHWIALTPFSFIRTTFLFWLAPPIILTHWHGSRKGESRDHEKSSFSLLQQLWSWRPNPLKCIRKGFPNITSWWISLF